MQTEAALLKGDSRTTVVALGLGRSPNVTELNIIASEPQSQNVFLVSDFTSPQDADEHLRNTICAGLYSPLISE